MRVHAQRDRGAVLPMVLVLVIALGAVTVGIATYATAGLRYGQVAESRSDRFAAADGALRDAIERMRLGAASAAIQCPTTSLTPVQRPFPIDINGANTVVTCQHAGSGASAISKWAMILTGRSLGSNPIFSSGGAGGSGDGKRINGAVYMHHEDVGATPAGSSDSPFDLNAKVNVIDGDVFFPDDSYGGPPASPCSSSGDRKVIDRWTNANGTGSERLIVSPAPRSGVCIPAASITAQLPKTAPTIPNATLTAMSPATTDMDGTDFDINGDSVIDDSDCREFSPGWYTSIDLPPGRSAYFKSGNYVFENFTLVVDKQGGANPTVVFGYPDLANGITTPITPDPAVWPCQSRLVADAPGAGVPGASVYLKGTARIDIRNGSLEMLPRHQGNFDWVSVQDFGSTLTATTTSIIETAAGAGQEAVFRGWVWAPNGWINFNNVTGNDADVRLSGGTAVARLHMGANATAGAFEIGMTATPARSIYTLQSVATKDGSSTTILATVEFANNPTRVAVRSWQVSNV